MTVVKTLRPVNQTGDVWVVKRDGVTVGVYLTQADAEKAAACR
jgi:hypothetical protein